MPTLTRWKAKNIIPTAIDVVESALTTALDARASDVHFIPDAHGLNIRIRVDGDIREIERIPHAHSSSLHSETIARIKVLGGLRTDEHFIAQDGRFKFGTTTQTDVRISIMPTHFGENAILRLLTSEGRDFTLATLGLSQKDATRIEESLAKPHGLILATGPTGSGKTTTLYTLLKMLAKPNRSTITIEDPIEFAIESVTQIQVRPPRLTFANGLRSMLRQDPDVIMLGEIRDTETAALAVNTALTGHLLLSTLHTNDAATTLPRLIDMKIDPYLIASTVQLSIAQRLVRTICASCTTPHALTPGEKSRLTSLFGRAQDSFQKGAGCAHCLGTGYRGRRGVYEVLSATNAVREAILTRASAREIIEIAKSEGMTTLAQSALEKAEAGFTSIDEVLRLSYE